MLNGVLGPMLCRDSNDFSWSLLPVALPEIDRREG